MKIVLASLYSFDFDIFWPRSADVTYFFDMQGPLLFEGKKIELRNTYFQIKGIFDGIRIFVWRTKFMIDPF